MEEIDRRIGSLERSVDLLMVAQQNLTKAVAQQSTLLAEQVTVSNRIAAQSERQTEQFEKIISTVIDLKTGVVPAEMIRLAEHTKVVDNLLDLNKKDRRGFLWAFGIIVTSAVGISAIASKVGETQSVKQGVEQIIEKAAEIKTAVEAVK